MPSRKREQTRLPLRAWLKRLLLRLRRLLPTRLLLRLTQMRLLPTRLLLTRLLLTRRRRSRLLRLTPHPARA